MPYYRYNRFRSPRRRGFFDPGRRMRSVDWSAYSLAKFEKKFYRECSSVRDRSRRDVEEFRSKYKVTVLGHNIPRPLFKFRETGFPSYIMDIIKKNHWDAPLPIQCQGWPVVLSGRDLVGIVQYGSGKTAGYLLPALVHAKSQPSLKRGEGPIVLIIVPTRELAQEVEKVAEEFCSYCGFRTACLYGGSSRSAQVEDLNRSPEVVIATPGRLLDFLDARHLNLRRCTYLVIDEADKLLDMGLEPTVRKAVSQVRPDRQTVMWSSSWPREVKALAEDFLYDYIQVNIGASRLGVGCNIKQYVEVLSENEKSKRLVSLLNSFDRSRVIILTENKKRTEELCEKLQAKEFEVSAVHTDKQPKEIDRTLDQLRAGRISVLVATDAALKGLDIPDVRYVVIYDYPAQTLDYTNQISRMGRGDRKGTVYAFFTSKQSRLARELVGILRDARQNVPEELVRISEGHLEEKNRSDERSWRRDRSESSRSRSLIKRGSIRRQRSSSSASRRSVSTSSRSHSRERSRSVHDRSYRPRNHSRSYSRNGRSVASGRSKSSSPVKRSRSYNSKSPSPNVRADSRSSSRDYGKKFRPKKSSQRSSSEASQRSVQKARSTSSPISDKRKRPLLKAKANGASIRSASSSERSVSPHRSRSRSSAKSPVSSQGGRSCQSHHSQRHISSDSVSPQRTSRSISKDMSHQHEICQSSNIRGSVSPCTSGRSKMISNEPLERPTQWSKSKTSYSKETSEKHLDTETRRRKSIPNTPDRKSSKISTFRDSESPDSRGASRAGRQHSEDDSPRDVHDPHSPNASYSRYKRKRVSRSPSPSHDEDSNDENSYSGRKFRKSSYRSRSPSTTCLLKRDRSRSYSDTSRTPKRSGESFHRR